MNHTGGLFTGYRYSLPAGTPADVIATPEMAVLSLAREGRVAAPPPVERSVLETCGTNISPRWRRQLWGTLSIQYHGGTGN